MVASASIKLDELSTLWLGSNAIYKSVMRIIALVFNGIRPSADRTRSCTDDRDDDDNDRVRRREDLR